MNGLSPLEERVGLSEARMRQRAAENASRIILARRMGATRAVRKAVDGGQRLMIFDARHELITTIDISAMSEGIVNEIERACVASPGVYQRQAVENPRPVRKAIRTAPAIACYDSSGTLVGAVDPGDLSKVAKKGDVAQFDAQGRVIGYASPKSLTPLRPLSSGAAKPKPAAPAAAAGPVNPTPEQVQKAMRLLRTPLRGGSPSYPELGWATKVLQARNRVTKAAASTVTKPAVPTGYQYRDGKIFRAGVQVGSGTRNASGGWSYSL